MDSEKIYTYVVLGGESHGMVFDGPLVSVLDVPCEDRRLGKMYAQSSPAEVTERKTIPHTVIEHIAADGRRYFIACNEDLANFDVEAEIAKISKK